MAAEQLPQISVIEPVGGAIGKLNVILFKPFDIGKWFTIGFCAWLAYLGKGGFGFRGPCGFNRPGSQAYESFHQAKDFIVHNLAWVIFIGLFGLIIMITLWLVLAWLRSRGDFMFLHCVAQNKAEVKTPWSKFKEHANSLFLFRIVLHLIGFVAIGLPCIIAGIFIFLAISGTGSKMALLPISILFFLFVFVLSIAFLLAHKFTTDFVVPIMFLRTASCTAAWREFLSMLSVNKGRFTLYILFQIVIGMAISVIILLAMIVTCCCAACFLVIPYIGTVLMLPLFVFKRAYSVCYLGQFGPSFDVFAPEAAGQPSL